MRDALFFLSLSIVISLYGVLGLKWGIIIALPFFCVSFWNLFVRLRITLFHLCTIVLIGIVLIKGVRGVPFSRSLLLTTTIMTILLVLAYTGSSRDIDIAPTFAVFVAIMLFLRTFVHIAIPERFSWSALVFLTAASMIEDWNIKRRGHELQENETCPS